MPFVISMCGQNNDYAFYETFQDGKNIRHNLRKTIRIKGGNRVMQAKALVTPESGVITELSEEDIQLLQTHPAFKRHLERGYVRVISKASNPERAAAGLEPEDNTAQLTPEDFSPEAAISEDVGDLKINDRKIPRRSGARRGRKRK